MVNPTQSEGPRGHPIRRDGWRMRVTSAAAHLRADLSFALVDTFLIVLAYSAALVMRFFESTAGIPQRWVDGFLTVLPFIVIVHLIFNVAFGTYGHVWEYASVAEAVRMIGAAAGAGALIMLTVLVSRQFVNPWGPIPVGVVAMGSLLTLAGMGAVRFRSRMFSFKRTQHPPGTQRTLVVGTGRAAADIARHVPLVGNGVTIAGFLGTNGRHPRLLAGLPVLGTLDDIGHLVDSHDIDQIIVAGAHDNELLRDLVDRCLSVDVRLRIMPDLDAVLEGNAPLRDIRDIELSDLLPRPEVSMDFAAVEAVLTGRRVLVTGAGGSIGSEIVRQVLGCNPLEVLAIDNDETHLFDAGLTWDKQLSRVTPTLCDIRDVASLHRVFSAFHPDVVFHAAAYKHVPILEQSVEEAVKTNVLGTQNVLDAARDVGVERFVLISTDKAVRPTSVMGASKRVAEMLLRTAAIGYPECRYSAVRFGNVLGSRGSVIPTFLHQIQHGGPVTVTDPEMVRYFMTVGEAVQLVLQAAALTDRGETFVLDMGEPIKIIDLARRLIRLAGLVPGRHIQVELTGARPGERLSEALAETDLRPASHPKIQIAEPPFPGPDLVVEAFSALQRELQTGANEAMRETLLSLAQGTWGSTEVVLSLGISEEQTLWK